MKVRLEEPDSWLTLVAYGTWLAERLEEVASPQYVRVEFPDPPTRAPRTLPLKGAPENVRVVVPTEATPEAEVP